MKLLDLCIKIAVVLCLIILGYNVFAVNADTYKPNRDVTAMPSWSTGTGYSECDEDVRVIVSSEPLKANDIQVLLSKNFEFVTVISYKEKFHWYFVRYENCEYYDSGFDLDLIPERRGW